jgi:hypothetical protein
LEDNHKKSGDPFACKPGKTVNFKYCTREMYQMNLETHKKRLMRRSLLYKDEWLQMGPRMQQLADDNNRDWNLKAYYDRSGAKAGGKGGWKGPRSRSATRR